MVSPPHPPPIAHVCFGLILWNEISDWEQDTTSTDAMEKLQDDMAVLRNYTVIFAVKIRMRFDKEFLIQAAITELGSHVASYDVAIWRLVSGHCLTLLLLTSEDRRREVDERVAPCAALWGRGAVGATCFLPH